MDGFNDIDVLFGTLNTTLSQVASMPNNSHSTIGGGVSTHIKQFQIVHHTMCKSLRLIDPVGTTHQFNANDIKIVNGLDATPVTLDSLLPLP